MRKRTNALRRLYQRTKNNDDLRESRRVQYATWKTPYQATIKKENIILEETLHCKITDESMKWVYKIAWGKTRQKETMTTLQKPDGTITADMTETLTVTMEQLIPQDSNQDDSLPQGNTKPC